MSSKSGWQPPLRCRREQQIPSAHQSGAAVLLNQQPSRPAAARILRNVLTRLQAAAAAAAAASDLPGNELSISRRPLEMYRPTRETRKSCYRAIFFFFSPIFIFLFGFFLPPVAPAFLLTLRLCVGVLSAWEASCHCSFFYVAPLCLCVGPPSRPPHHHQRRGSCDEEEPPADTHRHTDGMKVLQSFPSLPPSPPSLPLSIFALYCDFCFFLSGP